MTQLITAQTDTATSAKINIVNHRSGTGTRYDLSSTFRVTGGALGTGEYVKLQYYDGTSWLDANIDGNDAKILDEDNAISTVFGRMIDVRVSKSETSAALGVEVV